MKINFSDNLLHMFYYVPTGYDDTTFSVMTVVIAIALALIFGVVCVRIAENKGYDDGAKWFLYGFFLGILGVLLTCISPDNSKPTYTSSNSDSLLSRAAADTPDPTDWKCEFCGKYNPKYTGTCSCGKSHVESIKKHEALKEQANLQAKKADESSRLDRLKKYKELLDMGAITQEEFDKKKKELLS